MDFCDVGYGDISPYHVEVIVRYCISRYENCAKHQELATRQLQGIDENNKDGGGPGNRSGHLPAGGLQFPLKLDREVATTVLHQIRTPLTSIRSFTEILLTYPIEDRDASQKFLRIIQEEAKRLSRAVDHMFGVEEAPSSDTATKIAAGSPQTPHQFMPEAAID
jgi:signal transduction histidine kinase